jgi:hypothetical protein
LEEERRKLRSELRYRAKWHGEAAAKLGLTNNQLMMLEDFSDELKFGEGAGVEDEIISTLEGEVQSLKAKLADALMGTWSGRGGMLADGEDMASLASLQKQLALSKVDAATLQEEVVSARQANERLTAENRRIADKARAQPPFPTLPAHTGYSDEKVANRDAKVWHFVIEKGY